MARGLDERTLFLGGLSLVFLALSGVVFLIEKFDWEVSKGEFPLAIATDPEGATILVDGRVVGVSPLTVFVEPGPRTVTARAEGYASSSIALNLERDRLEGMGGARKLIKADPWVVNIALEEQARPATSEVDAMKGFPGGLPNPSSSPTVSSRAMLESPPGAQADLAPLKAEIAELRSLLLTDPEKAASFSVLQGRVENLDRGLDDLRNRVDTANDLKMWVVGLLLTIGLGIGGLIASLLKTRQPAQS